MIAAKREIERLTRAQQERSLTATEKDWLKRLVRAQQERERIRLAFPDEFNDGAKRAYSRNPLYPPGFKDWPLDRRNAFFAGFNVGYHDRRSAEGEDDG